ncbi:MAG: tRNA glutamyl-Q(34) synthetase GluQRS [Candidatus Nitricoxidivorans perseverans]|uniref:Glutamyl-Q tRNA(Asp) synthetase n=1 Tax=Candidatus Nitricoxidivorans perseverans TaxID=2975601 RepID=A0AA49IS45_9PROT|nr:MAG: tRNA glutamyl-Q(34) synthetase GluQRS [Candidatus Nitricoxidivorans perseverans]
MLPYRGRFAPSPTGPLHFGSLVAALGSCLEARARGGRWLVRMEDVDEPRCRRETADVILRQLAAFGFEWDGDVLWQSRRTARYREALEALRAAGHAYPCACTRREIADSALAPDGSHVYPGTCRNGLAPGKTARAWRLAVPAETICFDDAVQGRLCQDIARDAGDFVLLRADGYFAYQLAVVVDDADQGITHIVRGADLVDSTPRQILLQRLLGVPTPAYAHLPAAVNAAGEKLSKQTGAAPLDPADPALVAALGFLGQKPPGDLARASVAEIWAWARAHWTLARVPRTKALSAVVAAAVAGDADQQPHG